MKTLYVFFTFLFKNAFINAFHNIYGYKIPVLVRSLNWNKRESGESKQDLNLEHLDEFAQILAIWIKKQGYTNVVLILKDFGLSFKYRKQSHLKIDLKRKIVLKAFLKRDVSINTIVDASPIAFNGCKTKKKRRRKKKHFIKISSPLEKND